MIKNVLKEIIIILLLTLAVILLLGVLLYDYVPMNKVIPEKVTYTATEETRKALEEKQQMENDEVILSYEVTSTDLSNYKKVNDYKAGRKNPFSAVSSETTGGNTTNRDTTGSNSSNTNTSNSGSGNSNSGSGSNKDNETNANSNSTNYYPDKGIK